jgi:hypothetical protein
VLLLERAAEVERRGEVRAERVETRGEGLVLGEDGLGGGDLGLKLGLEVVLRSLLAREVVSKGGERKVVVFLVRVGNVGRRGRVVGWGIFVV